MVPALVRIGMASQGHWAMFGCEMPRTYLGCSQMHSLGYILCTLGYILCTLGYILCTLG